KSIFAIYLTPDLPFHPSVLESSSGDAAAACVKLIDDVVEHMYATNDDTRFFEVTYASGDKEVMYFKDFSSGAMIDSIVGRAKKAAIKRLLAHAQRGTQTD